ANDVEIFNALRRRTRDLDRPGNCHRALLCVGGRARSSPLGRAKVNVGCCARLDWSFLAPVAQGIERSPAEAEARGSNPLGRMRSWAGFAALFASRETARFP